MQRFATAFAILPFFAVFLSLSFFTWTALSLGSALTFIGAFFPQLLPGQPRDSGGNTAKIVIGPISVDFNGTLRFGMVVAGIVLLISGANEGGKDVGPALAKAQARSEAKPSALSRTTEDDLRLDVQEYDDDEPTTKPKKSRSKQ